MEQIEEWRPVKDWDGLYEVSDLGRVRNPRKGNRILDGWITKKGYVSVHLYYNGIYKKRLVHQLVAEAFCQNPNDKPFIDHINGIKTDNRASNLRWCTAKENQNNPLTIEALRRSKLGKKNPMFGKSPSDEVRKKIGDSQRGEKNHWYGKHLSREQKDRLAEWNKRTDWQSGTKQKTLLGLSVFPSCNTQRIWSWCGYGILRERPKGLSG